MTQEKLLQWIKEHPYCTPKDMADGYGIIGSKLARLKKSGKIRRITESYDDKKKYRTVKYVVI